MLPADELHRLYAVNCKGERFIDAASEMEKGTGLNPCSCQGSWGNGQQPHIRLTC